MLLKTPGIILHSLKYSDSALITTIYTPQLGRTPFIIHGAHKKKSKIRNSLLQPLSLVEIDLTFNPKNEIQQIKELKCSFPLINIPYNPIKNAIALFISEVLSRTLLTNETDDNLYDFLESSIKTLDILDEGIANFHLIFLCKLTKHLGFEPNQDEQSYDFLDLENGHFTNRQPLHSYFCSSNTSKHIALFLNSDYNNTNTIQLTRDERYNILNTLIEYYKLHIPGFHGINSLPILHSLFN